MERLNRFTQSCYSSEWRSEDKTKVMPCHCQTKKIAGTLKVLQKLGEGTCGTVYLAYLEGNVPGWYLNSNIQPHGHQEYIALCACALKINLPSYLAVKKYRKDEKYKLLFLKEQRILKILNETDKVHSLGGKNDDSLSTLDVPEELTLAKTTLGKKHVTQLAGSFVDLDGYFCLILSCGNHSLKELSLKNPKEDRNGLPLYMLQLLALHILNGLEYIHSLNIVHGDLKPSNIFWNGDAGCFFIGDFSHSIVLWEKPEHPVQSCHYRAPEVYNWNYFCRKGGELPAECNKVNPPTTKIDVWSLGCILLEMSGKDLNAFSKWVEQHIANRDERAEGKKVESISTLFEDIWKRIYCSDSQINDRFDQLTLDCLQWHSTDRPSAEDVLKEEFFTRTYQPNTLDMLLLSSRVLQLSNVVDIKNLQHLEASEIDDIINDIREECENFGEVISLCCPGYHHSLLRGDNSSHDNHNHSCDLHEGHNNLEDSVFVEFRSSFDCQEAQKCLMGRTFDGKTVLTSFFPVDRYLERNF